MDYLQTLSWTSIEAIYLGGYALVISVSFLTIAIARRAAQTQELEAARAALNAETQETTAQNAPVPLTPSTLKMTGARTHSAIKAAA